MDEKTINKLTDEPVSKAFLDVVRRLNENIFVSPKEINDLPEIQYANLCAANREMSKEELEKRFPIRVNVFSRLQKNIKSAVTQSDGTISFNGEIRCDKRLDIVIGLPAAGKSSALAEPLSEFYKSRLIDCDEAKKILPGFDGGWGAGFVHPESQRISDKQFNKAIEKGENITYPRVGADCNDLKKYIEQAKKAGYKVYVHYNELDRNKALARMLSRFIETGRYLSPNLIDGKSEGIQNTYSELKQSCCDAPGKLIDGFSHWDNDVPFGERPILKECSETCIDFCKSEKQTKRKEVRDKPSSEIRQLRQEIEQLKLDRKILLGKLNEVTDVFKQMPPEFTKAYVQKRKELRSQSPPSRDGNDRAKPPKPPNPKKPKH